MDRRETGPEKSAYLKDLEEKDDSDIDDKIVENGVEFRVPYKMIKQAVFSNIKKEELRDIEHGARLQYRLMLLDAVLRAKVEFVKQTITVIYNPPEAKNRKEKISLEGLIEFLAKEGVHADRDSISNSDYDYYKEIYQYEFNPPSIRERAPYSYTKEQWSSMKNEFWAKTAKQEEEKRDKYHRWQNEFAGEVAEKNPELAKQLPKAEVKEEKKSLSQKLFGGKKKKKDQEKGFWFHGA